MGSKAYNGWAGEIRDIRGNRFYALLKQKQLPPPETCFVCGSIHQKQGWNTYHAEEYGSTWADYVRGTKALCPYCHGMMHMRYRHPNRFKRFKDRVGKGILLDKRPHFESLQKFFQVAWKLKDIAYYPEEESGIPWLDGAQLELYKGPPKIATAIVDGVEIPDPKVYGAYGSDWTSLSGVILTIDGSITEVDWS